MNTGKSLDLRGDLSGDLLGDFGTSPLDLFDLSGDLLGDFGTSPLDLLRPLLRLTDKATSRQQPVDQNKFKLSNKDKTRKK